MNKKTIIFVEGINVIGKKYFINKFKEEYTKQYPDSVISQINISDYFSSDLINELRTYNNKALSMELLDTIFNIQLKVIEDIHTILQSNCDTVIVNRSFKSFLIYNIYSQSNDIYEVTHDSHLIEVCEETYKNKFNEKLGNYNTVLVNLIYTYHLTIDKLAILEKRMRKKNIFLTIEKQQYFKRLFHIYDIEAENPFYKAIFDNQEFITSSDYSYILGKYIG